MGLIDNLKENVAGFGKKVLDKMGDNACCDEDKKAGEKNERQEIQMQ